MSKKLYNDIFHSNFVLVCSRIPGLSILSRISVKLCFLGAKCMSFTVLCAVMHVECGTRNWNEASIILENGEIIDGDFTLFAKKLYKKFAEFYLLSCVHVFSAWKVPSNVGEYY